MSTNKKMLSIIIVMMLSVSFLSIAIFIYNFKDYSIKHTTEKAISIAQNVRDGLTSHMVNGTMDKRAFFLSNIANNQKIYNFHLYRAPSVISEYGPGFANEIEITSIEKKALETSHIQTQLIESLDDVTLKVSIPYIASSSANPNCISCHTKAKNGDVLGVISMDMKVNSTRIEGISIAINVFIIVIILLIFSIIVVHYFIKPYIKLFDDLENGISNAYRGDFNYKIDTTLTNEAGEVADRLNELAEIYKFKKTIDLDEDKIVIYNRIIQILKSKFSITQLILFEVNNINKLREVIVNTTGNSVKDIDSNLSLCRAFRTRAKVNSDDFEDICLNCDQKTKNFVCLYYSINEEYSVVLHIQQKGSELKEYISVINNYFEMAKPVIESKILMDKLKETTLIDPMTTLYNRRFLNELVESNIPNRTNKNYIHSILMIDIDFFKQVNDTYGHEVGDTVIKGVAKIMKESVRNSDMPVRYGGEEFLILLLNTTREESVIIANKIRNRFASEEFFSTNKSFNKTLSVGIAHYPDHGETIWKVIKFADEALYYAKNNGRNKAITFDKSMHKDGVNY